MEMSMKLTEMWDGLAFSLPMEYFVLVLGALALCLIWGQFKTGILTAFGAFVYWGYLANKTGILQFLDQGSVGTLVAMFIGMGMLLFVLMTIVEDSH